MIQKRFLISQLKIQIDEFEGQRPKSQEEQIEGPLGALFAQIDATQQPGPSRTTAYSPVDGLKEESESYNVGFEAFGL